MGSQRILSKLGQPGTLDDIAVIEKVNGNVKIDYILKQTNTNDHIQGHYKWIGEDGTVMTAGKSGKIPPGILKKYSNLPNDSIDNGQTDKYERNQYFFHPDHLGSTSFITDASGEVSQHTEYLPFGEILVDDRPANDKNPYLYNGKELDEETGLYYYGARFYDAQIGRFIGVDPIIEKFPFLTPYNYASNNPVTNIDLWGLQGINRNNVWDITNGAVRGVTDNLLGTRTRENYIPTNSAVYNDAVMKADAVSIAFGIALEVHGAGGIAAGLGGAAFTEGATLPVAAVGAGEAALGAFIVSNALGNFSDSFAKANENGDDLLQGGNRLDDSKVKKAPDKRGNAPIGEDDKPVELHHREQTSNGPIDEMTQTDHRGGNNFKENHSNTGQSQSNIDRKEFKEKKKEHWRKKWDSGRFDDK